jgi:hypothetical protein
MKYSTQEDFAERVRGVTFFDTADLVCFCSRSKLCSNRLVLVPMGSEQGSLLREIKRRTS